MTAEKATRRDFLKTSTAAVAAGALASGIASRAYAGGGETLKVGLVGCGGRGNGAAQQALAADENVKLFAMADAFKDRLDNSLKALQKSKSGSKVAVDDDHKFVGLESYKQLIDCCDVVLLCSPPGFRPSHLKYAVEKGKHVFCEKPVAVDGPGVRSILETVEEARKKKLAIVSGLCWRYHIGKREAIKRALDGQIGKITAMQCTYNTGELWHQARKPEWSEMEYQCRNWLYFTWLSGDHNTEQHIHSLDKMAWVMGDKYPVRVTSIGGRQKRTGPEYGHVYDHFVSTYEWDNGVKLFSSCRQMAGCDSNVSDNIFGTKGALHITGNPSAGDEISGETPWKYEKEGDKDMYQVEHDELFASIRKGEPINNGVYMAHSSLMAIMARMSAYTGKTISWTQALNSKEDTFPKTLAWGPNPVPGVAIPGVTKFV